MGAKKLKIPIPHKTFEADGTTLVLMQRCDIIKLIKNLSLKWESPLTAVTVSQPEEYLEYASRFFLAAGIVAQKLSIGVFMWAPIGDGQFLWAGEMTPIMYPCLKELPPPPFAGVLGSLEYRINVGKGFDADSENLFHQLEKVLGTKDQVLTRLRVKRGLHKKVRK